MKGLLTATLLVFFSLSGFAQTNDAGGAKDSDKLDLKKLEDKYWAAKDTDFSVVQNRAYTKANRYFLSLGYGPLINDEWSIGRMTNIAAGYYFSERWGVELAHEMGDLRDNDGVGELNDHGAMPNYNKFKTYTSVNAIWVPFYAKMSFLDKKIVYFDMQFALGLGNMVYEIQKDPSEGGSQSKTAIGVNFDFTQQLFFSEHFAFRLDLKNKFTSQDRRVYKFSGSIKPSEDLGATTRQDTTFLLGFTYFY
jgi:outer membrane beta-barrel protein